MIRGALLVLAACAWPTSRAAEDCAAALQTAAPLIAQAEGVRVAFVSRPSPAPVGEHFSIDFVVCTGDVARSDARVQIDADMPAHRHGMNYRASVAARGGGVFRAEGLMFHMPGRWRLLFDVELGERRLRLSREIEVQ